VNRQIRVGDSKCHLTFSTRNFDPLAPFTPKFPNFAIQILLFCLKHTVAVVTKFLLHLGTGCCLPKQRLGPKLEGGWARGASKKWDALRISATVEASNFKFGTQIGLRSSLLNKKLSYRREAARCRVLLSILVSR